MFSKLMKKEIDVQNMKELLLIYKADSERYLGAYEYKQAIRELLEFLEENDDDKTEFESEMIV